MNDDTVSSIAQLRAFGKFARGIEFQASSQKEQYEWIATILDRFQYPRLRKYDESAVKTYIRQMTGFSRAQLTRLIQKKKKYHVIVASNEEASSMQNNLYHR